MVQGQIFFSEVLYIYITTELSAAADYFSSKKVSVAFLQQY